MAEIIHFEEDVFIQRLFSVHLEKFYNPLEEKKMTEDPGECSSYRESYNSWSLGYSSQQSAKNYDFCVA